MEQTWAPSVDSNDSNLTSVAVRAFTFSTRRCKCCQASSGVSCNSDARRSTYIAQEERNTTLRQSQAPIRASKLPHKKNRIGVCVR